MRVEQVSLAGQSQYGVVYDILAEGLGFMRYVVVIGVLAGTVAGTVVLVRSRRRRELRNTVFMAIWLVGWMGLGGLGAGNVIYQQLRCREWARQGNYNV